MEIGLEYGEICFNSVHEPVLTRNSYCSGFDAMYEYLLHEMPGWK